MKSHPAIEHAFAAFASLMRSPRGQGLNGDQGRNLITIEVDDDGMCDILRDHREMRYNYGELVGPLTFAGFRIYRVHRLPDGDHWRVLNALGKN